MPSNDVIEQLLESACPSIRYRVRREILDEPADSNQLRALQQEILQDESVQTLERSQQPDGWLGERFHGYDSLEAGIRLLCEKGVSSTRSVLARALTALVTNDERLHRELGRVGTVLDERGFGGTLMMQAAALAHAGLEQTRQVRRQIDVALDGLRAVAAVESIDEIVEPYKTALVFKDGVRWPSIYHLRVLALTASWRTEEAQCLVTAAVGRLVDLSPIPFVHVRRGSQLVAPASFAMQDFNPDLPALDAGEWMLWFHRTELLARLGVVNDVPEVRRQVDTLREMVDANQGWFRRALAHDYFRRWGAYTGLMLERDWRAPRRRECDLTFRSLLIAHYADRQPAPGRMGRPDAPERDPRARQ